VLRSTNIFTVVGQLLSFSIYKL